MAKIRPLPNDVVQLIAAGEVIDSLGAVVRELAENAIDAGATRIAIDINPRLWRIRVVDNGSGMELDDLKLCLLHLLLQSNNSVRCVVATRGKRTSVHTNAASFLPVLLLLGVTCCC